VFFFFIKNHFSKSQANNTSKNTNMQSPTEPGAREGIQKLVEEVRNVLQSMTSIDSPKENVGK